MNKDTRKIYKKLEKDLSKNKPKLVKLCEEYVKTQNNDLLPDISYFTERVFEDEQDLLLVLIATGEDKYKVGDL